MSKSKLFLSASLILLVSSFDLKASEAKFPNSSGNAKGQSKGKQHIDKKSENFYSTFIKQNFNEFEKGDINSKNNIDFNKLDDFFTKRIAKKLLNKEITLKDMFRNIKVITKVDNFDISNEVIELLQSSQNILTLKEAKREIEKKHYAALLHNAYGIDQDDADFIADSVILNKAKNFKDACESILNIDDYEGVSIQTAVIDKMFKEGLLLQDAMKECKREVHINELKGLGFSSRESSDLADIIMRGGSKLSALEKHLSRQAYATYKNVNCADLIAEEILNNKISLKEAILKTQRLVDENIEAENQLKTAANTASQPEEMKEDSDFADMLSVTYKGLNKAQIKEIVKMLDETDLSSDEAVTKLISPRYLEENLNSPHKLQAMLDLIKEGKSIQEAFDTLNQPEEKEEDSGFADMLSVTYKGLNKAQIKEIVKMLDETDLSSDEAVTKLISPRYLEENLNSPHKLQAMLDLIKEGKSIQEAFDTLNQPEEKEEDSGFADMLSVTYKGLNKAQIKEIVKMLDETDLSSDEAVTKLISPRYLEENLNSPHKLQAMLDLIKEGKSIQEAFDTLNQPEEMKEDSGFADMLSVTYKGLNKAQIKEIVKMLDETDLSSDEAVTKLISPRYLEENLNSPHKLQAMLDLIKAGKSIQEAFDTLNQPEEKEEDSGFADMLSVTYKGLNKAQIKEIVKMLDETDLSSDEAVIKLLTNFKAELFHSPDLLNTMLTFIKNGQTIEKSYEEASIEEGKKLVDYFYKGLIETDLEQTSRLHFYSKKPYTAENIKESLHKYIRNLGYDNKIAENLVERTYLNKSRKTFRKQSLEMFCKDILSKLANKEQAELLLKNEEKVKEENKARLARKQQWDAASFRAKVVSGSLRNGLICEVTFKSNNNTQKLDLGELFYVAPQAYKTFFNLPDHISIGDEIRFHTIRNNGKLFSTGMGEDIVVPNPNYNKPIYDVDGKFAEMDIKPEVRLSGKLKLVSEILSPENIKPSYAYQALLKWGTFEKGYIGIITEARPNGIADAKDQLKALNLDQVKDFEDFIETCVKVGYKNSNFNPYQAINNSLYGASDFNEEDFNPSLSVQEMRHKLAWFFRERLVYIAPKQYQTDFAKDEMELNTYLKIETISSNAIKTPFATGDYDRLNEVTSLFK